MTDIQHLVTCLKTISNKHFTPGSTTVLFSSSRMEDNSSVTLAPSTINDLESHLILELNDVPLGPSVVFRHPKENTVGSFDQEVQELYRNYIILVYVEKESEVIEELGEKLYLLSNEASWNPRARFVVSVTMTSKVYNCQTTAKILLDELRSFKIFNVIVIIKSPQTQTSGREAGTFRNIQDKNLEIYTWFPYQHQDRCSTIHDVILLDIWLMEGNGRFKNNVNLFPDKVTYNLNKCPITAATFPIDFVVGPYTYIQTNDSTTSQSPYLTYDSGIELRFIKLVAERLNLTLRFLLPPPNNEKWGNLTEEGKLTGLLGQVVLGKADIGFGAWPLHLQLITIMDATKTYYRDDWLWWVPCAKKVPRWKSISMVFLPETWIILFLSIISAVLVILGLVTCEPTEGRTYRNCVNCASSVWATVLGVSTPYMPRTTPIRIFLVSWIWYCLAINVIFQTLLTTFLIEPGLQHQMNSIEEILTSKVKYGYNEWFDIFVRDSADEISKTILHDRMVCNEGNKPPCLDWTAYHSNFSILCSKTLVSYLLTREYVDRNGKPLICQAGGLFFPLNYVTYMEKWNPLLNRFNDMITRILESGIDGNWFESGLHMQRVYAGVTGRKTATAEYSHISLEHAQGIFAVLVPGLLLSVVIFFIELSYHKILRITRGKC
ncbi:hypothetical protein Cfor_05827 [Coptotermes formosanus]|uniref:Ionotropic glutamate receptor C-terminal domain-containing protein n=1 Tax=Coptotermes formosanus TaxID=36987 RepID=A0A6L2Q736_COPFO|nr:hypothetical protein Cfor_05827 [Coptotermes formosanus]